MDNESKLEPVRIELSRDESLVLFELLARFEETNSLKLANNAEFVAVSSLSGKLQSVLLEPFDPEYGNLLAQASARLCEGYEGPAPGVEL